MILKFQQGDNITGNQEIVITPNGSRVIPTLNNYLNQQAQNSRQQAVLGILRQSYPNVPIIPSRSFPSIIAAKSGWSDRARMAAFGCQPGYTCIYTATHQYNDPWSIVSGNKTFAEDPSKYGFTPIERSNADKGDLIQILDNNNIPYHSVIVTNKDSNGDPIVSYSNGNTGVFGYDDISRTYVRTMKKNKPINSFFTNRPWKYNVFRYNGTREQRSKWASEYFRKYNLNPRDYIPKQINPTTE